MFDYGFLLFKYHPKLLKSVLGSEFTPVFSVCWQVLILKKNSKQRMKSCDHIILLSEGAILAYSLTWPLLQSVPCMESSGPLSNLHGVTVQVSLGPGLSLKSALALLQEIHQAMSISSFSHPKDCPVISSWCASLWWRDSAWAHRFNFLPSWETQQFL